MQFYSCVLGGDHRGGKDVPFLVLGNEVVKYLNGQA